MNFKGVQEVKDIKNKRVLVRSGLNVHIKDGSVVDDFRLLRSLPTISFLRQLGAKVIVLSHIDEKEGGTLEPVAEYFESFFPLTFVKKFMREEAEVAITNMKGGEVTLFENLRVEKGEEGNDEFFIKKLASYGDLYVNDAFSVSHRKHSSITGLPKLLPSFAGLQLQSEVDHLSMALKPKHSPLLILGGAKPETKIPLVKKFLSISSNIFIAGVTANEIFKANGFELGKSVVSEKQIDVDGIAGNDKVVLPEDVIVSSSSGQLVKGPHLLKPDEVIVDVGPRTMIRLGELVSKAKLVIWNGPLGVYEEGFTKNTEELARMLASSRAYKIVGGGDTFTVIGALRYEEKFDFISTAGGAMIQFLSDGTLPGIIALESAR